jgi:hypothetical protein
VSLRQALAAGERSTITTVLKWVLPQAQQLEKRAFVGYYLSFPDVSGVACAHRADPASWNRQH